MSLYEDIQTYKEPNDIRFKNPVIPTFVALNKLPPKHSTDNGLLFSCTYWILLKDKEELSQEINWLYNLVESCEITPGLYNRYPGDVSLNSHDDLTGIAAASWSIRGTWRWCILDYAKQHNYYFNNEHPSDGFITTWRKFGLKYAIEPWLGRMPGFSSFLKATAGEKLTWFDVIWASIPFIGDMFADKQETNGRCLLWLKAAPLLNNSKVLDWVINTWKAHMMNLYPKGLKDMYTIYYGAEHPLTRNAPETF